MPIEDIQAVQPLTIAEENAITSFYRAFETNDWGLLLSVVTPDWQSFPATPGQAAGPEAFQKIFETYMKAFS